MAGGRYEGTHVAEFAAAAPGMSLRDYFAAKAMAALINNEFLAQGINELVASGKATRDDLIAKVAYTQADAMLRARGEA